MQSIFSNALSRAVAKHIDLSVTRRETLSWLTLLIMQHGTICLWRLAAYVASMAQTDSVRRRFYRFFQFVRLDSALAAQVVVELLGLPSVPMMVRHRSPKSLASHGRRTTITWSCKTKKRKRTVPPGLVRREAGGRPQCRPRWRRRPNCRIGRGVGLLRCRRSCVFWQRLTPPPTLVGSEQSCAEKACTHRS